MDGPAPALLYDVVARFRRFNDERVKTCNYRGAQCRNSIRSAITTGGPAIHAVYRCRLVDKR